MGDGVGAVRVFLVEVVAVSLEGGNVDLPGEFIFDAALETIGLVAPPGFFGGEFLDADGLGLGIALVAGRIGMLVVPDFLGWRALGEEQQVGLDAGVGGEDAVGQADDGVQVALAEQLFLDPRFDAFAEQRAVGQDNGGTAVVPEQFDDQHEEEIGGFLGTHVGGEVGFGAGFLGAAEGRIGQDDINLITRAIVDQRARQGVVVADLAGHFNAVQQHVGGAQQVRHLLLFDAVDGGLQQDVILDALALGFQVFQRAGEKAASAAGRVENLFAQARIYLIDHELGDGARRVELARITGALQILEDFFVEVVE